MTKIIIILRDWIFRTGNHSSGKLCFSNSRTQKSLQISRYYIILNQTARLTVRVCTICLLQDLTLSAWRWFYSMKFTACYKQTQKSPPTPLALPLFLSFRLLRRFRFVSFRNIAIQDGRCCYKLPLSGSMRKIRRILMHFISFGCRFNRTTPRSSGSNRYSFFSTCVTYACRWTTDGAASTLARAAAIAPRRRWGLEAISAASPACWSWWKAQSLWRWTREIVWHEPAIRKQMISWGIRWFAWFDHTTKIEIQVMIILRNRGFWERKIFERHVLVSKMWHRIVRWVL